MSAHKWQTHSTKLSDVCQHSSSRLSAKQEHNGQAAGAYTFGGELLDRAQNSGEHLTATLLNICAHMVQATDRNLF